MKSFHKPKAIIWDVDETLIEGTSWIYLIDGLKADERLHMQVYYFRFISLGSRRLLTSDKHIVLAIR
jgi:hypothetical protein